MGTLAAKFRDASPKSIQDTNQGMELADLELRNHVLILSAYHNRDWLPVQMHASQNGHGEVAEGPSEKKLSALAYASYFGRVNTVAELLKNGAEVDLLMEDGWSSLMFASQNGHGEVAKILIENKAKVNLQNENGRSALMSASQNGHGEVAKILLGNGAMVNLQKEDGWSALMLASLMGHGEVAKILIENGAKVDLQEKEGWSALMLASLMEHGEVAKILIEKGAKVDLQEKEGWSALMLASQSGHGEAVKMLIENKAKVNLQKEDGWSALMLASQMGQGEVAELLLKKGAEVNLQEKGGWSALMSAIQKGHGEVAKILIENGANVDLQTEDGLSAVMLASQKGHGEVAKILIENNAKVDLQEEEEWSALLSASQKGHVEIVEVLIENGAKVNLQKENGWSALMLASQYGQVNVAKMLMDNGAKVNLQSKYHFSALIITSDEHYGHAIKLLKENLTEILINDKSSPTCYSSLGESKLVISLRNGVRVESLPSFCSTFLISSHEGHDEVIRLLERRANMTADNQQGLETAVQYGHEKNIVVEIQGKTKVHEVVLTSGGSWYLHSDCRYSPLILASIFGHSEIARLLLENGATANEQMDNRMSALMFASQNGHADVVQVLLEYGALVNLANNYNQTSLLLATEARDKHVICFVGRHTTSENLLPKVYQTTSENPPPEVHQTVPSMTTIYQSFSQPVPRVRILGRITKSALFICSKFASMLENIVDNNTIFSWSALFQFSTSYLSEPLQTQNKSCMNIVNHHRQGKSPFLLVTSKSGVRDNNSQAKKLDYNTILAKKVSKKLKDGDLRGAVQLAKSSDIPADISDETYEALKSQFKPRPPDSYIPPIPTNRDEKDFGKVTTSTIVRAIRSLPSGSAGGPGLLRPRHLKDMIQSCKGDPNAPLLKVLVKFCKLVLNGNVPSHVRPFFFGAHLLALKTKSGEVRSILVGCTLRRLVAKVASYLVKDDMTHLLGPHQLGYGVQGGAEAAVHAARHYLASMSDGKALVKIKFENAFNSLRRDRMLEAVHDLCPVLYPYVYTAYAEPTYLVWKERTLISAEGLQQGDPLAPLLFCLSLHKHYSQFKSELSLQYVDHVVLGGNLENLLHDMRVLTDIMKVFGLQCKSEVMSKNNFSIRHNLCKSFPSLQSISLSNATLLGSPLGDYPGISKTLLQNVDNLKRLKIFFKHLESRESLVLLRSSFFLSNLQFLFRTFPCHNSHTLKHYDDCQREILCVVTNPPIELDSTTWGLATLPVKLGGLGLQSAVNTAASAFLASSHASSDLVRAILPHSPPLLLNEATASWSQSHDKLPPEGTRACKQKHWNAPKVNAAAKLCVKDDEDSARLVALSTRESRQWLHAPPVSTSFLKLDNEAVRYLLELQLGIKGSPNCLLCGAPVDPLGRHFLKCPHL